MSATPVILLSVRPPHVDRLLDGTKTVEIRRRPIPGIAGATVLLYASRTVRGIVGSFIAGAPATGALESIWARYGPSARLTREEFDAYLADRATAHAIPATEVKRLPTAIRLSELRQRWPAFNPPQSYRRVTEAEVRHILNGERRFLF